MTTIAGCKTARDNQEDPSIENRHGFIGIHKMIMYFSAKLKMTKSSTSNNFFKTFSQWLLIH